MKYWIPIGWFTVVWTMGLMLTAAQGNYNSMKIFNDLSYGPEAVEKLDLYVPPSGTAPVLVFVHGGAWIGGDKSDYASLGHAFAGQGISVAVIDYTLAIGSKETQHPAPPKDLSRAIAWLGAHASDYGFDAKRIFIMGHSAGAHMAAYVAGEGEADVRPAGYIGLEGIYDIPKIVKGFPTYRGWFIETAFGKDEKGWIEASPSRRAVKLKSPWLVVHSETDELVDTAQSAEFAGHLKASGVSVETISPNGPSHFGVLDGLGSESNPITRRVLDFIRRPQTGSL